MGSDRIVRAITDDGAFRVLAAVLSETVRSAVALQGLAVPNAGYFGDLFTATVLFRETMAPRLRVQCVVEQQAGGDRLVVDSHPDGGARGIAFVKSDPMELGGAFFRGQRAMPSGKTHEGVVEIPATGGIAAGLMAYLQESEQIVSVVALGTVCAGGSVGAAGGFVVQLLPEAGPQALAAMTAHLTGLPPIAEQLAGDPTPERLIAGVLEGVAYTPLETSEVCFRCRCSQERVEAAIATLGRADHQATVEAGIPLEVKCDYCRTSYTVGLGFLRRLLDQQPC